jgi:hypothetical protein
MKLLPVRLSHMLSHSGVGAIVRGPEGLMVVQDIRQWTDRQGKPAGEIIPYVERVRTALGIEQDLREPPVAREVERGHVDGVCVPATRFPFWARCPHCGKLHYKPWRAQENEPPRCDCDRHSSLEQLAWVLVDPAGYLADVPWLYLTHKDERNPKQRQCKTRDRLYLIERQGRYLLRCAECGAEKDFPEKDFRDNEPVGFGQHPMQPWTRETPPPESAQANEAGSAAQILRANDVRVYSPVNERVLVIPPESRTRRGTVVDRLYRNSGDRASVDSARNPLAKKSALQELARKYRCARTEVEQAFADFEKGYPLYGQSFTPGMLLESEYRAFLETLPDQRDDEDFVNRDRSAEWQSLCQTLAPNLRAEVAPVRHLVRVDRLKVIQVFRGFRRMQGKQTISPDLVGKSDWFPAIQLYGEGVFFTLEESLLSCWENNEAVLARTRQLLPRFFQAGREQPNPLTARFLLLHTLAHLLIRQLEAEGGYPAASLSERIYCGHAPGNKMAGILIYVAVPDIAGSLGGLAELAEPRRFLGILVKALEHARWCAFDPVCGEHEGQGPGLLNRAACHACALVPEPACDYGNTLLDRVFVKGDAASGFPSLFGDFS